VETGRETVEALSAVRDFTVETPCFTVKNTGFLPFRVIVVF